jgi:ribosomal subunit interface protein
MNMYIHTHGFSLSEALKNAVKDSIAALRSRHQQIYNIDVRLEDINGSHHGGTDKRCSMMVTIPGSPAMMVSSTDGDMYLAIRQCAARLRHTLDRGRARQNRKNARSSGDGMMEIMLAGQ